MVVTVTSNDSINWNAKTEIEKKINQVSNLLRTLKGEIPFMRDKGISNELIDNPFPSIKPVLINEVTAVISENVENVTLQSVDFLDGESIGDFIIKVVCEIE